MKSIFCHSDCKFEFKVRTEHCPKCGRFVGDFIRRTLSNDALEQQKEDYRNGIRSPESMYHAGPGAYGVKGW